MMHYNTTTQTDSARESRCDALFIIDGSEQPVAQQREDYWGVEADPGQNSESISALSWCSEVEQIWPESQLELTAP